MDKYVADRFSNFTKSKIRQMFYLAGEYDDVVNLAIGEPDFDTPEFIINSALQDALDGYTHYTHTAGFAELREVIADKFRSDNDLDVQADQVMATVGANNAMALSMLATLNLGDEVLFPDPGFPNYSVQIQLGGGVPVPIRTDESNGFQMTPESLREAITSKTKAILVNSPNNPTGAVYSEEILAGIAEVARENDLLVYSDEVYESFVYSGQHYSIASFEGMSERCITINALSKSHAMTGWRLGYATGPKTIIDAMIKLNEKINTCPSSVAQRAALAALQGPIEPVQEMARAYEERRDILVDGLNELPGVSCYKPRGSFYVFPNIKDLGITCDDAAMQILEKARVVSVPGSGFGSAGKGYLRMCCTVSKEEITEAVRRLKDAFENGLIG